MNWPLDLIKKAKNIINDISCDNISPSKNDILNVFDIDPSKIKVIILGQDPYPTPGVSNGLAFAVNDGIRIPASLNNIFKEIIEIRGVLKTDRTLSHWKNQGVLLLNTSLTVENFKPNSHKKIWKEFIDELIKWMSDNLNVIWVLWGNEAKRKKKIIGNQMIIEDAHPSPLSVRHRTKQTFVILKHIDW